MYLVQVQEIGDNSNPGNVFHPIFVNHPVWKTRFQTGIKPEAQDARDILREYYVSVRIMVTREAVELTDEMQELL